MSFASLDHAATWLLSNAEPISHLTTTLGVIITAIFGVIQLRNYTREKKREIAIKQIEVTANAVDEVLKSNAYKQMSVLLDIDGSIFTFKDTEDFRIYHSQIEDIFRTKNMALTDDEINIRECFDIYARLLTQLEIGLSQDLYLEQQIGSLFQHDVDRILQHKQLLEYLVFFKQVKAVEFIKRYSKEK